MSPEAGFARPEIARSVVDLPAPLAPSKVTTCPSSTLKRNAAQRFDFAVADNEIADFEQRHLFSPEIGGDDIGVTQHRHGFAVRDTASEIEYGDMLGRLGDERHVVVDDQDGEALAPRCV